MRRRRRRSSHPEIMPILAHPHPHHLMIGRKTPQPRPHLEEHEDDEEGDAAEDEEPDWC